MHIERANITSKAFTGNTVLPHRPNRSFFFIVMGTGATGTIRFGEGDGEIPLSAGFHFMPSVVPISKITITTTGSFVIAEA